MQGSTAGKDAQLGKSFPPLPSRDMLSWLACAWAIHHADGSGLRAVGRLTCSRVLLV